MPNSHIRSEIKKHHKISQSWQKTADEFNRRFGVHLSKASYDAWITRGIEPADKSVRDALGLGSRRCPTCHRTMGSLKRNQRYNDNLPEYMRRWRALKKDERDAIILEAMKNPPE